MDVLGPFEPTVPWQAGAEYLTVAGAIDTSIYDNATVLVDIQVSGTDEYQPGCFLIGEGDAELRWLMGDDRLRWLGPDSVLRWTAEYRLGTGQC